MLAPTHVIFAISLNLIILSVFGVAIGLHWSIMLVGAIGSILPDIDLPSSTIGTLFRFISVPLERKFGHRTITHSLIGWMIATLSFILVLVIIWMILHLLPLTSARQHELTIARFATRWIAAFSIGYASHILLDMFNPKGSQLLWPDQSRDVIPGNVKFRIHTGSRAEIAVFGFLLIVMMTSFPISKFGLYTSLRWLLGTPESAIEEFKSTKCITYVEFKGIYAKTREPIEGQAEVITATKGRLLVRLKDGQLATLSSELTTDITASHVRVHPTKTPIHTETKTFTDKSRDELLAGLPENILISGHIDLPEGLTLKLPQKKSGNTPISQSGTKLTLTYATPEEIRALNFDEIYQFELRKEQQVIEQLQDEIALINRQIATLQKPSGLTPLGEQFLISDQERAKKQDQIAKLKAKQSKTQLQIEEHQLKLKMRKPVFSGTVMFRYLDETHRR